MSSDLPPAPLLRSWLTSTRRRLEPYRPRARVERAIRREVRRQLDRRDRQLIDGVLRDAALQTLLEREFTRQWEQQKSDLEPSTADTNRDFTTELLLGSRSRYDRTLVPSRYDRLAAEISELTGGSDVRSSMRQAYRSVLAAETDGLGRIAGSNYNIIGKLVVPPLLRPPPGPVLEIGTLFGLFSPVLIQQFRRVGEFRELTVIDPLDGIQIQPEMAPRGDPTGTPVDSVVVRHNLERCGLRADEFRIVRGLSTEGSARSEVADRAYAVVIVDGDHSEDGVHQDLWWTQDLLLPGGIAVVDDFGDPKWPGVERATQRYLADGGQLQLLGRAATSAYLRMPA